MSFQKSEELSFSDTGISHTCETLKSEEVTSNQKRVMEGILIILSGPSGVGKNEMMKRIRKDFPEIKNPRSKTTRPPRSSEYDNEGNLISQYEHLSMEEFEELIAADAFLEHEWSEENHHYYGTGFDQVEEGLKNGDIMIKEIDVKGRKTAVTKLPKENVYSIFLTIDNPQSLRDRIKARGDDMPEVEIENRIENAFKEIKESVTYDEVITSIEGNIEATFQLVKAAIEKVIS